jgi:hypothetical protein
MYLYTDFDQQLINERVAQFRDQTERYLAGKLTEDEYRPLRLQNGLYVQRYAPMLRIAVPYGLMNSTQLRKVAELATGDVFKDVLNYMKRSGFDTFVIKEGKDILEAAAGLNDFRNPYQASTAVAQASYQTGA